MSCKDLHTNKSAECQFAVHISLLLKISEKHKCMKISGTVYQGANSILKDYFTVPHALSYSSSQFYISCSQSWNKQWGRLFSQDTSQIPKQMRMNVLFSFGGNCHSLQWRDINKYTSNYITCHRADSHKMNSSFLKA